MTTPQTNDVVIRREGHAGRIALNRPKALNALTYAMVTAIWDALTAWQDDPAVELVLLDGAGERGLCAGGDVRAMYDSAPQGAGFAKKFWADEYRLNALIGRYPKPYVAFMDGIVMGGGIGLSAHGSRRIVTDRSELAMPETGIGLIPDVGGTWLLAHAPGEIGVYLGLTGERMRGAGTIYAGFADTFVPAAKLGALAVALGQARADTLDAVIASFAGQPPASDLAARADVINRTFCGNTLGAIRDALQAEGSAWSVKTLATLRTRSPLALAATLAAIRRARTLGSLEEALDVEYRLTTRLFEHGEFIEGVRALIVDKDRSPKWRPPRLEDVTGAMVEALFLPVHRS
ncbi:MAG: enoyl-CoA hydratase/isomerase family protein [Hyphomicrobiaceae bacterium]